jgi:hypothetical protein
VVLDQPGAVLGGCGVYLNIPSGDGKGRFSFNNVHSTQVGDNCRIKELILVNVNDLDGLNELKTNFNNVCSDLSIVIENKDSTISIKDILCEQPCENPEYVIELFVRFVFYL